MNTNIAERQFLTELVLGKGPTDSELLQDRIGTLERERKILRAALRKLLGTDHSETVRQIAISALTAASTPQDPGLRESSGGGVGVTWAKAVFDPEEKLTQPTRRSFRGNPELDQSCRMTPDQIEARSIAAADDATMRSVPCPSCDGTGKSVFEPAGAEQVCPCCNGARYVPA